MAAGLSVATAGLVATGFSGQLAFGDGAESVAGVRSLGILHAPGYPAYVLVGRAFAEVVRVGDLALRLNLLSAVCSVATVPLVYAAARRIGTGRVAAAGGALALATSLTFWFYAGYAKPYAATALVLAGLVWLALAWGDRGGRWRAAAFGALVGLASGLSYQVVVVALPGIAILALVHRRPAVRDLLAGAAAAAVVATAVWGFVAVRARDDPALNWGRATSAGRLVRLARMADFGVGSARPSLRAQPAAQQEAPPGGGLGRRLVRYPTVVGREFSALAVVVAAAGVAGSLAGVAGRRARRAAPGLALMLAGNTGAVLFVVFKGDGPEPGLSNVLRYGGFLLAANLATAWFVSLGLDVTGALAARAFTRLRADRVGAGRVRRGAGRGAQRRAARRRAAAVSPALAPAVAAVLAAAVVVPAAAAHAAPASHRGPPFAADYAANVLGSLPPRAVLLTWDAERSFPLLAAQVDGKRRRDVDVVLGELLLAPWYRDQLRARLGVALPERPAGDWFDEAIALARRLQARRPVYADLVTLGFVGQRPGVGYRQAGLVARIEPGSSERVTEAGACERDLQGRYRTEGLYAGDARRRWPNDRMLAVYAPAHVLCGSALLAAGDAAGARRHARLALAVDPHSDVAHRLLAEADRRG